MLKIKREDGLELFDCNEARALGVDCMDRRRPGVSSSPSSRGWELDSVPSGAGITMVGISYITQQKHTLTNVHTKNARPAKHKHKHTNTNNLKQISIHKHKLQASCICFLQINDDIMTMRAAPHFC